MDWWLSSHPRPQTLNPTPNPTPTRAPRPRDRRSVPPLSRCARAVRGGAGMGVASSRRAPEDVAVCSQSAPAAGKEGAGLQAERERRDNSLTGGEGNQSARRIREPERRGCAPIGQRRRRAGGGESVRRGAALLPVGGAERWGEGRRRRRSGG